MKSMMLICISKAAASLSLWSRSVYILELTKRKRANTLCMHAEDAPRAGSLGKIQTAECIYLKRLDLCRVCGFVSADDKSPPPPPSLCCIEQDGNLMRPNCIQLIVFIVPLAACRLWWREIKLEIKSAPASMGRHLVFCPAARAQWAPKHARDSGGIILVES